MTDSKIKVSRLIEEIPNRFILCMATAIRARQLKEGSRALVQVDPKENVPIITALEELSAHKLKVVVSDAKKEGDTILEDITPYMDKDLMEARPLNAGEGGEGAGAEEDDSKRDSKSKKKARSLAA